MASGDIMNEVVVRLSTQIDNQGMNQILGFLDTTKFKTMAVTGAFAGLTTAVYKFLSATVTKELELRSLAEQQKKNIDNLRVQQQTLSTMGKTLKEIEKDKTLKKIYDDVEAFNKSFNTMDASSIINKINSLRTAFYKVKSAISIVVQEIGKQVLVNLEGPIDSITGKLSKLANWIRDHLTHITTKVASFITGFAKGVLAIAETLENVAKFFQSIPASIRAIAGAMGAIALVLNSGPFGKLLAAIEIIGTIKHAYSNYQWNKANQNGGKGYWKKGKGWTKDNDEADKENGVEVPYQIPLMPLFESLFGIYDGEGTTEEKIGNIFTELIKSAAEGLQNFWDTAEGDNVIKSFLGGGENGGIVGAIERWLKNEDNIKACEALGQALITFLSGTVTNVGGFFGENIGLLINAILGDGTIPEDAFTGKGNEDKAATLAGAIGGFFANFFNTITDPDVEGNKLIEAFKSGLEGGFFGSLITAFLSSIEWEESEIDGQKVKSINWEKTLGKTFESLGLVGEAFVNMIVAGIEKIGDIGTIIFGAIATAIENSAGDNATLAPMVDAFRILGNKDGSQLGKTLTEALFVGLLSGNVFAGLGTALLSIVDFDSSDTQEAKTKAEQFGEELGEFVGKITETITNVWEGTLEDPNDPNSKRTGGIAKKLQEFIFGPEGKPEEGIFSKGFNFIGDTGKTIVQSILKAIGEAISGYSVNDANPEEVNALGGAVGGIIKGLASNETFSGAIAAGIAGTAITGSSAGGIVAAIIQLIQTAIDNPEGFQKDIDSLVESLSKFWDVVWKGWTDQEGKSHQGILNKLLLGDVTNPKDNGIIGWITEQGKSIYDTVVSVLEPVGSYIQSWLDLLLFELDRKIHEGAIGDILSLMQIGNGPYTNANKLTEIDGNVFTLENAVKNGVDYATIVKGLQRVSEISKQAEKEGVLVDTQQKMQSFSDYMKEKGKEGNENLTYEQYARQQYESQMKLLEGKTDPYSMMLLEAYNELYGPYLKPTDPNDIDPAKAKNADYLKRTEEAEAQRLKKEQEEYNDEKMVNLIHELNEKPSNGEETPETEQTDAINSASQTLETTLTANQAEETSLLAEGVNQLGEIAQNTHIEGGESGTTTTDSSGDSGSSTQNPVAKASTKTATALDGTSTSAELTGQKFGVLTGKAGALVGAFDDAKSAAGKLASAMKKAASSSDDGDDGGDTEAAWGGRIGSEMNNVTVGEDGTEYIIPITKPERAYSLITQMLNEMGSSAINRVFNGLGLGQSGTIGASMSSLGSAMSGMVMNNTYNISAPVTITVTANGANAEDIGTQAYNLAERHLVKTMMGVYS